MLSPTKVCLFIRVSTQQQDYDRQISDLTSYCEQKGYVIAKTIATKITGTKTLSDRQDLQELLNAANRNVFSKVIVTEISRIGRNASDIRNTIDQLHQKKIAVVFKNLGGLESIDDLGNTSFVSRVIISIYAELAQEEKRILSERIRSGLAEVRRKGIKTIGRPKGGEDLEAVKKKYAKLIADLKKGRSLSEASKLHN